MVKTPGEGSERKRSKDEVRSRRAVRRRGRDDSSELMALLPLRADIVFPQTISPLIVNRSSGIRLLDDVQGNKHLVGLITQRRPEDDDPGQDDLYPIFCVGTILKMLKFPDGSTRVVMQGVSRARLIEVVRTEPYLVGRVEPMDEIEHEGVETEALVHHVTNLFDRMVEQSGQVPEELQVAVMNTRDPGRLADLLASSLPFPIEEKQNALAEADVKARLQLLGPLLARQLAVMELAGKIQAQVGSELSRAQREHFLRQQIKAIQEELGESDAETSENDALWKKIEAAKPPADVRADARRELDRLRDMHPSSAEFSIVRTYLDWIAALPWAKSSVDSLDLKRAQRVLDADHYNLVKVKERILEYLAVRKLKKDMKGPILCLVGPPGTGKTSLGRSIAKALGREFVRVSLGGVHDEAEIRGHRRTYVAAMPGRIIQGIRKAGKNNPVFVLDEVDKIGADFRGDPASALLEVLDPEQNFSFRDHYLDLDFDLSKVLFLATANMLETIPPPLLDRMEVLQLPGYSEEEKILIAQKFIIPKQLEAHGLAATDVAFGDDTVKRVIADYTREAGLRNLEREMAAICRKLARRVAEGKKLKPRVEPAEVPTYLGPSKYYREVADRTGSPGVATGLAWTPTGGEILFVEATAMPGKGGLTLTGLLGESMKESAQAALTYLRTRARVLGLDANKVAKTDVHIHVPAGAVPKDGPSAGVAIAAALLSLFRELPIRSDLAMTGEVTLTGRVLPVGGVRDKILAARRAGIKSVLVPHHNEKDLAELPPEVKSDITFHVVETLDDVVAQLFEARKPAAAGPRLNRVKPPGRGARATVLRKGPAEQLREEPA